MDAETAAPVEEMAPQEEASLGPVQHPAPLQPPVTLFDPVSGLLRVFYPEDSPYDEPSMQAAAAAGHMGMPSLYYTADAVAAGSCGLCNRQFADAGAVLHHLRDHKAHRDSPEAAEAAYVLQCQEEGSAPATPGYGYYPAADGVWGGYDQYNTGAWQAPDYSAAMLMSPAAASYPPCMDMYVPAVDVEGGLQEGLQGPLAPPPSDVYTGSEHGSDAMQQGLVMGMPAMAVATSQDAMFGGQGKHGARRRRGGVRTKAHHVRQQQAAPKPEEYEQAFPPLSSAPAVPVPVSPPKWGRPASTITAATTQARAKLRADAREYQPLPSQPPAICTAAGSSNDSQAAEKTPSTPGTPASGSSKGLRVDAPAWQPLAA